MNRNLQKTHLHQNNRILNYRKISIGESTRIFFLVIVHVGIALVAENVSFLSTLHALIVFVLSLWTVLTSKDIKKVVPYAAYMMGAEVFWRMTSANIFSEFGKYAISLMFMIGLLKQKRAKNIGLPLLFFLLLIPSIFLTIDAYGLSERTRQLISFNLSGILAASMCMMFFKQIKADPDLMKQIVWSAVLPIISIFTVAAYSTITATEIYYGSESIFITSGGFGPNQVSAVLGLGALLLIMLTIQSAKASGRFLSLGLSLALITQSFLTFSRGGVYNLAVSLSAALLILLSKPSKFTKSLFLVFIVLAGIGFFIFPKLEQVTGGALSTRFTDLDPTNREELVAADIRIFIQNPLFGVGPGVASYMRGKPFYVAAHTEYTRILAEHGALGIVALLILIIIMLRGFLQAPDVSSKAWMVSFAAWALFEMTHAAMRMVAIPFMLGLALIGWQNAATDLKEKT